MDKVTQEVLDLLVNPIFGQPAVQDIDVPAPIKPHARQVQAFTGAVGIWYAIACQIQLDFGVVNLPFAHKLLPCFASMQGDVKLDNVLQLDIRPNLFQAEHLFVTELLGRVDFARASYQTIGLEISYLPQ